MSLKNQLNPPKPPSTLGFTHSEKGFFSRILFSLGLKHEHIEDFNALVQLKQEREEPIIDEALDYQPLNTDMSVDKDEEVLIAINGVEQENKDISFDVKEKPEQKIIRKTNFTQDSQSPLDSGKPGHFSQDTEYTFKKTLAEEFSTFDEDSQSKGDSSWMGTVDENINGQNNISHTSEKIDFAKPKNNSLFTKEVEGESL